MPVLSEMIKALETAYPPELAENWDAVHIDGSPERHDCAVSYSRGGRTLALATMARDLESLQAEARMEREILAHA